MRKGQLIIRSLVFLVLFQGFCFGQSRSRNTSGLSFLKLGVGGRAAGLGEAYTAVADEVFAAYWNPAGLANLKNAQLGFTHTEWIQDVTSEYFAFAFPLLKGSVALSLNSNHVSGIQRRIIPSDEPAGTVDANDLALGLSYGRGLSSVFTGGITVKYLYEKIYLDSASGFALDLGLLVQPFQNPLKLAVVAQNIGSMGKLRNESIELPSTLRVGAAYFIELTAVAGGLLLTADGVKQFSNDSGLRGNFGLELQLKKIMAFRMGYQTGFDEKSLAGGLGFHFKNYHLNYGFTPFGADIGNTHRLSFGLDL